MAGVRSPQLHEGGEHAPYLQGGGGGGPPTGKAGGGLEGEYPEPAIREEAVTLAKLTASVRGKVEKAIQPGAVEVITKAMLTAALQAELGGGEPEWKALESVNASIEEKSPPLRCALDAFGFVHIVGHFEVSAELAANTALFTLPALLHPTFAQSLHQPFNTQLSQVTTISTAGVFSSSSAIVAKQLMGLAIFFPLKH
jgi:hypothetical protein